ncbi:hypothetical protein [Pontiella desulfatans]|nr:hypothetical protein [Pontiella desulfatans]
MARLILTASVVLLAACGNAMQPVDYVNPLIGTAPLEDPIVGFNVLRNEGRLRFLMGSEPRIE